jgi:hypothetical protein
MYRFQCDVTRPESPLDLLDVTGVNGLAQAAGIASFWIRRGMAERVEILNGQRLVLTISRFDVRLADDPRGQDTYQVRALDRQHALRRLPKQPNCEMRWSPPMSICCPKVRPWSRFAEADPPSPS